MIELEHKNETDNDSIDIELLTALKNAKNLSDLKLSRQSKHNWINRYEKLGAAFPGALVTGFLLGKKISQTSSQKTTDQFIGSIDIQSELGFNLILIDQNEISIIKYWENFTVKPGSKLQVNIPITITSQFAEANFEDLLPLNNELKFEQESIHANANDQEPYIYRIHAEIDDKSNGSSAGFVFKYKGNLKKEDAFQYFGGFSYLPTSTFKTVIITHDEVYKKKEMQFLQFFREPVIESYLRRFDYDQTSLMEIMTHCEKFEPYFASPRLQKENSREFLESLPEVLVTKIKELINVENANFYVYESYNINPLLYVIGVFSLE